MRWKANAHSSHSRLKGLVDHLGPSPYTMSGGDHMIGPTISLRGLGASPLSRVEYSTTYVEALT